MLLEVILAFFFFQAEDGIRDDLVTGVQTCALPLAALAQPLAVIGEPGAGFFDDAGLDAEIEDLAHLGDAFAIHDVELDLLERRRQLVLHHLDAGLVADHFVAFLDGADAADVEADRGVKFQRVAAGGGFRRTVHHPDLHADLVDEDYHGVGLVDRGGELAQRLAHQPRLQSRQRIAHLALEFGLRHQCCNGVDHQHVDRAGAHQRVADFQRLLAGVGLRDQQFIDVDAELARIDRIERVFGIDEGADAALLLPFRHRVQRQRGFARGFRPVDFNHPPTWQAADAQRDIEPERARRNGLDVHRTVVLAQLRHRALAELALDLGERGGQGLGLIHGGSFDDTQGSGGHNTCSLWRGFASGTNGRRQFWTTAYRNLVPPLFYVRNM